MILSLVLVLLLACTPCPSGAVCLDDGWYYVDEPAAPTHTLLWLHGWNEDADHLRGRASDHQALLDAGFRILQPYGEGETWDSARRDDIAFLSQVVAGEQDVLVAGHSVGASMASELACQTDVVAGLGAMHGTFWDPMPVCTTSPKPVRHVHGTGDTTWPLEGRAFFGMEQGDVREGVEVWRALNDCSDETRDEEDGPSTCTVWDCAGAEVRYCEHDGLHRMEDGFGARLAAWWKEQG